MNDESRLLRRLIFGAIAVVTGGMAAWWFIVSRSYEEMEERGQFGDAFGGINAVFSGLALCGVVTALYFQAKELALQRQQLREQQELGLAESAPYFRTVAVIEKTPAKLVIDIENTGAPVDIQTAICLTDNAMAVRIRRGWVESSESLRLSIEGDLEFKSLVLVHIFFDDRYGRSRRKRAAIVPQTGELYFGRRAEQGELSLKFNLPKEFDDQD